MIELLLFALTELAGGNPSLLTRVETISTDSFGVSGLNMTLELEEFGLRGDLEIAQVRLIESGEAFDDIRIACGRIALTTRTVTCKRGLLTATVPGIGRQSVPATFSYDMDTGSTRVQLTSVAVAGGRARADIVADGAGIDVRFSGKNHQLDGLIDIARGYTGTLDDYAAAGISNISGRLRISPNDSTRLTLNADVQSASLANNAGTIAAEGVAGQIELDLALFGTRTEFDLTVASDQGEAYVEPAYANFSEHAMRLQAQHIETLDFLEFEVGEFLLQQDSLLHMVGSAKVTLPEDEATSIQTSADIKLTDTSLATLYTNLVQVAFAGTVLGNMETDGRLSGRLRVANNAVIAANVQLEDIILDDTQGRFAIYGVRGNLDWQSDPDAVPGSSEIQWDSGTAYNIILGGGETTLQLGEDDIELLAPLRIPTMGGALVINQLELKDYGSDNAAGVLDAELEPIQLGQLAGAFGWPAFSGTLSGRLPLLRLVENTMTVGGTLSAQAFDGTVQVSGLQIEQPFGLVPRLRAEVQFRDLDLRRVTEAFSFGLIQGRLSGDVSELEMLDWSPVAMDMHFYTPANDKTQHRISQRAVENLASVGGSGAAAVLSTGFLQFFEVFAYDQIGLRCLLRDGICAMSGVGPSRASPAGRGYYIVKGSGLPRIDVVGYRNNVSWNRLVQQLAAITRSASPTIK